VSRRHQDSARGEQRQGRDGPATEDAPDGRKEAERHERRRDEVQGEQRADRGNHGVGVDVVLLDVVDSDPEQGQRAEVAAQSRQGGATGWIRTLGIPIGAHGFSRSAHQHEAASSRSRRATRSAGRWSRLCYEAPFGGADSQVLLRAERRAPAFNARARPSPAAALAADEPEEYEQRLGTRSLTSAVAVVDLRRTGALADRPKR
jgi:hypothetical protein